MRVVAALIVLACPTLSQSADEIEVAASGSSSVVPSPAVAETATEGALKAGSPAGRSLARAVAAVVEMAVVVVAALAVGEVAMTTVSQVGLVVQVAASCRQRHRSRLKKSNYPTWAEMTTDGGELVLVSVRPI
jgi:hypothetical protein